MKRLLIGALAAWITVSCWALPKENVRQDRYNNKTTLITYDNGTELVVGNQRANANFETIVDGGTNTFTVMGVSLDDIKAATEAIQTAIEADGILAQNIQGGTPDGEARTVNAVTTGGEDQDGNVRTHYVCKDGSQFIKTNATVLDNCDAATGFSAVLDASTIAASTTHIAGTNALSWNKSGGSNVISGVQKTITTTEIVCVGGEQIGYLFYIPDAAALTDIEYTFIRIGEDSSNYLEWQVADEDLVVGWNRILRSFINPASQTGDGTSTGNAKWIAVGCETDDAADTITGLIIDEVVLNHTAKTAIVEAIAEVLDIGVVRLRDGNSDARQDIELDSAKIAGYVQSESLASAAAQADIGLQLGVIEGGVTTGTASLAVIEANALSQSSKMYSTGLTAQELQGTYTEGDALGSKGKAIAVMGKDNGGLVRGIRVNTAGVIVQGSQAPAGGADNLTDFAVYSHSSASDSSCIPYTYGLVYDALAASWQRIRGNSTGGMFVQGASADGASNTANALKCGGEDQDGNMRTLQINTEGHAIIHGGENELDNCDATTGWAAVGSEAGNITTDVTHIEGTLSLEWDKATGSATTAAVAKTITTLAVTDLADQTAHFSLNLPDAQAVTDIDYVFLRIGEDASNYLEYQWTEEAVGWNNIQFALADPTSQTGAGLSTANIKYIAVGVDTDDAADTITDMYLDGIHIHHTMATNLVKSSVSDIDIGQVRIRDRNSNTQADVATDSSFNAMYVMSESLASEASLEACETALEIIDDWDATHDSAASADGPQVMGAAALTALPSAVSDNADAVRDLKDGYGRTLLGIMPEHFEATTNTGNATSAHTIKAGTAGRKMYILTLTLSAQPGMAVKFEDEVGPTTKVEWIYLPATGGWEKKWPEAAPMIINTDEDFNLVADTAGFVSVYISGYTAP